MCSAAAAAANILYIYLWFRLGLVFFVPREELENDFVRLQEENLHLKNHANKQDDEMKKLGTKLKKMANDQDRLTQLVLGRGQVRLVDQQLGVMVEDLQQRLQALERQSKELKQHKHLVRQQGCLRNGGNFAYLGQQKLQNNVPSCFLTLPKKIRRLGRGKPPSGPLEEARAEISSLNKKNMLQQDHIKEMEEALELLQDQLRKKEVEHQKKLQQIQKQEASKIWSNVENNLTLTNLQKQVTEKSNTVAELQEGFLQMQKSHRTLKANYHTAVAQINDLLAQLNKEKEKSFQLEKRLQVPTADDDRVRGLHQQLAQVKEERDVLRERISTLHRHTCDACRAQKSQIQEQQVQISQLQTALKAELVDKNVVLSKFKSEQEANEALAAEMRQLKSECREKQQQLAELNRRLDHYTGEMSELDEALLLVKNRKNREEKESQTGGVAEVEDRAKAMEELQEAHNRTVQELQKSKKVLSAEREICNDFKLKLEAVTRRIHKDRARAEHKHPTQLLGAGAAETSSLEAQLRRSGAVTQAGRPEFIRGRGSREECVQLECGEGHIDLQVVGARLSSSALELLGEREPATFCTYVFFRFDIHGTPVVRGQHPKYSFTSKYIVGMEEAFLDYVSGCSVLVELHQRLVGCEWRTMATAHLPLRQLLEGEGKAEGSVPLVSLTNEALAFGSLDYSIRLKLPVTQEASGKSPAASAWVRSWATA